MSDPDDWLTKAQAAEALGVDERTIERKARQGLLGAKGRPGFPTRYNPADVARLAAQGRPGVRPAILAADPTANGNGHGALQVGSKVESPIEGLLSQVLQAVLHALPDGPTGPTGPTPAPTGPTRYVSLAEALAIAGISRHALRQAVTAGEVKMRGRRYRRADLEAL